MIEHREDPETIRRLDDMNAHLSGISRTLIEIKQILKEQRNPNPMHMFSYPVMIDPETGEVTV